MKNKIIDYFFKVSKEGDILEKIKIIHIYFFTYLQTWYYPMVELEE